MEERVTGKTTEGLERYRPGEEDGVDYGFSAMHSDPDGQWVRYEDAAAALSLERERRKAGEEKGRVSGARPIDVMEPRWGVADAGEAEAARDHYLQEREEARAVQDEMQVEIRKAQSDLATLQARHEAAIKWAREGRESAEALGATRIALAYSQFLEKLEP